MYFKRKELIMVTVAFLLGAGPMLIYHMWQTEQQTGQLEQLISTSRELFGQQRYLISNYYDSFTTLYDCTLEPKGCDLKVGTERLQMLEKEREKIIREMNQRSGEVEDIIGKNVWSQYAEDR